MGAAIRLPFRQPSLPDADAPELDPEEQLAKVIREHDLNQLFVASTAATGFASVRAVTVKPGGAAVQVSPCDIQTRWRAGVPDSSMPPEPSSAEVSSTEVSSTVAPYSAAPVRSTVPPSSATISWKP